MYVCMAQDALKLVRRMWPHRSARGMRAPGMGPVGLPWPGPGFDQGAGTEVAPLWGPGADKNSALRPRGSAPLAPAGWRVLLDDGTCPSAVSIALSGVPAKNICM